MLKSLIIFGYLLIASNLFSQEKDLFSVKDTLPMNQIAFEQIPGSSIEVIFRFDKMASQLIDDEILEEEHRITNELLSHIDSLILLEAGISIDSIVPRNLTNKRTFWLNYQSILKKRDAQLEGIIKDLSLKRKTINTTVHQWQNTLQQMDSLSMDSLITNSINEVITKAEELQRLVLYKSNLVFPLLKNVKKSQLSIDELLLRINSINKQQYAQLFSRTQPALWNIDFKRLNYHQLIKHLSFFWQDNTSAIKQFYQSNSNRLTYLILYFLLLLAGLYILSIKYLKNRHYSGNMFKQATILILQRPFSVALLLTIFSSGLFLIHRPPILIDISIILLIIPLTDILAHITHHREKRYLVVFFLLILLRFINYIFPPVSPFNRIILLLMGGIEISFWVSLIHHFSQKKMNIQALGYFLRFIFIFHLLAAITGLIAAVVGQLQLAEIAIDLSITNTLVGLLLMVSSITLLGLLHLLIDLKQLSHLNVLQTHKNVIKKRLNIIVILLAIFFWLDSVIKILRISRSFYETITSAFNAEVSLGLISFSMGSVMLFFVIIWISVVISGIIRAILEDDVLHNISLSKGVPRMISVVIRFSLISAGVVLAISAVGMPLNQLTILFSAFSVGIGFGLQNIVNNFVSGVILLFERPIQIGDTVEIGTLIGTIKSMGIRSSKVRTFDGAEVIVPNANLISNELINWTLSDKRRRIEIISGVAYGSDVYKTQTLLLEAISEHPDVLQDPAPLVLFNDLGESSLDFRLLFWTDNFDNWIIIKSEMIFKIHDALNEAGISIPFPQRDLHIKSSELPPNDNK
ncbi:MULTISPECIES: mechanosensitive ion channel family protein [unclassified Carboxylicivirga]|uniref:mechanosensitive ion channel family protein n=1 Tax=Carboxylicivirga TaxID=1628153 RepID=UPI003D33B671